MQALSLSQVIPVGSRLEQIGQYDHRRLRSLLVQEQQKSQRPFLDPHGGSLEVGSGSNVHEEAHLPDAVGALGLLVERRRHIDNSVFYDVLKRCIAENDLILGIRVHALASKAGFDSDTFVANHIIRMYSHHGRLEEATKVFNKVCRADSHMWASIILAYARHGLPAVAIKFYRQSRHLNGQPDNHILVAVLKACASAKDLAAGREVHADILGIPDKPNAFVCNCLVSMYAKCGSLEDARRVFDNLPNKNVVTWTAMIAGYVQQGLGPEALSLYESMHQEGLTTANSVTFSCLLQACAGIGDLRKGKELHAQIRREGLEADLVLGTCLVDMYAKCGSLVDAQEVFDGLASKNVVTWNAMIAGYVQHGLGQEALMLYETMQKEDTTLADRVTYLCLLRACGSTGALHLGQQLHAELLERGLHTDVDLGNCLVSMYAKCGSLDNARTVFDTLPSRDVVSWNAMIAGYAQHGLGQDALALYAAMQLEGMPPADHVTFLCLLQACSSVGALHHGKQLHSQLKERGLDTDAVLGTSLVLMYAKCGSLVNAREVFHKLHMRDVVTWNALLTGYAEQTDGQMALECFEEMRQQGVEPDDATFICLLVACSHTGLVHQGQRFFKMMVEEHDITPTVNHYNCMVDLLARSGHLNDAENMLRSMPFKDDIVGWTSLLSACKNYGDVERGISCFNYIRQVNSKYAPAYVLMGNIYANAGRWSAVDELESMRKHAGAWKKPAKACIEVENKVHEFTVGDERSDVSTKLRTVNSRLTKEEGYLPQTNLVLNAACEQQKEDALCGHAEKLALAFGLLNTSDGTTLLVTKNLRMCTDCHSSTKIMSRVEKREIIVRDAYRVHRFQDGSCTCGDRH